MKHFRVHKAFAQYSTSMLGLKVYVGEVPKEIEEPNFDPIKASNQNI